MASSNNLSQAHCKQTPTFMEYTKDSMVKRRAENEFSVVIVMLRRFSCLAFTES